MLVRTNNFRTLISTGNFVNSQYILVQINNQAINIPEQIQKLDSVHDFGGSRGNNLATDSLSKRRDNPNQNYCYNQMTLSFIQRYSFTNTNIIAPINIQSFSSFSYPGCAPIQRIVDDVENCCLLGAMQESLTPQGGMTYNINYEYRDVDLKNINNLQETKRSIALFFANYTNNEENGTNKINFIVDTPGDITKILKSDRTEQTNKFAYILTQESAHDSAKGKPTPLEPLILNQAYRGNGYVEAFQGSNDANNQLLQNALLAQVNRTYTNPQFESNFAINFTDMRFETTPTKSFFSTNVTYSKANNFNRTITCNLNSLIHPTNVPQITKEVTRIIKNSNLFLQHITQAPLVGNNMIGINQFYHNFNNYGNGTYYNTNTNANDLDFNFTKKRAGDGLQAKIVQLLNSIGYQGLPCYKMGIGRGSCNNDILFIIRKAVLVTIDRVLFSYCIRNRIPAIYSGTNCILMFKPPPPPPAGGSLLSLSMSLPLSEIKPKYSTNERLTPFNRNVQIGGTPETEMVYDIMDIPFCIFKLMPRILYERLNPAGWAILRSKYSNLSDKDVITHYGNERSCIFYREYPFRENNIKDRDDYDFIFTQGNGYNALPNDYVIWFDDIFNVYKTDENDEITFHIETIYLSLKYLPEIKYTQNLASFGAVEILKIITALPFYFTRLQRQIKSEGLHLNVDAVRAFLLEDTHESYLDHQDTYFGGRHHGGAKDDDDNVSPEKLLIPDNPKLNVFLNFFYNNDISLDKEKLTTNNFLALSAYLSIFDRYEINMCFDNDKYDQDFIKISETLPEVSNKTSMYLFFKFLLEDFPEQHDKICYGLMEYFINEGDGNNNYFAIADDLQTQIYYIYCDEIVRPYYVNEIIEQNISDGTINAEDPIFINTKTYFEELYSRINEKNIEITTYLNHPNREENIQDNIELEEYIKTYFNMYGFMNMIIDFMDSIFEPEPEPESAAIPESIPVPTVGSVEDNAEIAKGIPGLSTEERLKRIEEQQARSASSPLSSSSIPKNPLSPFDPSKQKTSLDVSTFSEGNDMSNMVTSNLSTNIGNRRGGKTKKYRSNQKRLKSKKNKKHNMRQQPKTRRNRKKKCKKNSRRK